MAARLDNKPQPKTKKTTKKKNKKGLQDLLVIQASFADSPPSHNHHHHHPRSARPPSHDTLSNGKGEATCETTAQWCPRCASFLSLISQKRKRR